MCVCEVSGGVGGQGTTYKVRKWRWISQEVLKVRHIYQSGSYKDPALPTHTSLPLPPSLCGDKETLYSNGLLENISSRSCGRRTVSGPITETHSTGFSRLVEQRGLKAASQHNERPAEAAQFIAT